MNYEQLLEVLRQNSDAKYKQFTEQIVNGNVPLIGVRLPFLRKLSKQITLEEALSYPIHSFLEVDTIVGMVVSKAKLPFDEKAGLLVDFASTIENWSVCDCNVVKVGRAESRQYFDFFVGLVCSDKPFVCRYGVVSLLSNYLDDEHITAVFSALKSISIRGEYYVDMAVAWLLATAMAKCRNQTMDYLCGEGRLVVGEFAYNKALQKMRDSFRVSAEDKARTYSMKR